MLVIVPEYLDRAITEKIDEAVGIYPTLEADREKIHSELVGIFNEHGHINVRILHKIGPRG